jgi:rhodanese-related sulfurtransferase
VREQYSTGRRRFLAGSAVALAGTTGLAGCLGGSGGDGNADPGDDSYADGYPPEQESPPDEREIDESNFKMLDVDGTQVPAIPLDVAYYWFQRREARFADARGEQGFDESHILGAVLSPAPDGLDGDDPVADWPKADRIVCYCGCPHHLSALRAATLKQNGYENTYVIDEGFWAWFDAGYPMAGAEVTSQPALQVISGVADAASAGETAWAWHEPSGQREATEIAADGSYELHLRFSEVTDDSPIVVETPDYRVEGTLAELVANGVRDPES